MREAMTFHIESMLEDGDEIPAPMSSTVEVEVPASIG